MTNARITVLLELPSGYNRSIVYEVAGDLDRANILFNTLKDAAWAASVYVQPDAQPEPECIVSATQPHDVTCWRCAPEAK